MSDQTPPGRRAIAASTAAVNGLQPASWQAYADQLAAAAEAERSVEARIELERRVLEASRASRGGLASLVFMLLWRLSDADLQDVLTSYRARASLPRD